LTLRRIAGALTLLCSCLPCPAAQPERSPAERQQVDARREALRARMERLQAELAEAEGNRSEAREELRDSERAISEANRALRGLSQRRDAARAELAGLAVRRGQVETAAAARERELGRLLAAIYVAGEPGTVRLLLSGGDPAQVSRDIHYVSYVSRSHAALAESLRADLARLEELQARAREAAEEVAAIERSQKTGRDELLRQQAARRKVLQQISSRMQAQRREVKLLQGDEARLARLVERLSRPLEAAPGLRNEAVPESEPSGTPFASLKGRLRLPVRGTVAHRFGANRPEGGPAWKGVFIRASQGAEVRAVAAGLIVFADWMRGYGNLLIVDHGAGYLTIYGNNESLLKAVGERVRGGETISTAGASGGGVETGLYFEARHEGKAFDPIAWVSLR
jgi:septal ring factor EnvC (AmiA/AmiB activator)